MSGDSLNDLAGAWLRRAQWQSTIFADAPRRADLLALAADWPCTPFRLRVHRNQPFEFVASVLSPFLAFGGWTADVSYGDYDDSLSLRIEGTADVELLWIDFERYGARRASPEFRAWFRGRVEALRGLTDGTILVADCALRDAESRTLDQALREIAREVPGVRVFPLSAIAEALGEATFDRRAARITGMTLSDAACLRAARDLGLVWLPAALGPRLKAVAVDLDNTLYAGVLGEDGPGGLELSPAHVELHRKLLALRESGIFLALASRNEAVDVDRLFAERPDFPLRPEHFSARSIAFRSKEGGLREIADALRISPDAVLFVDDNAGEIAAVAAQLPGIRVLHAADPALACRALDRYPGLHGYPEGRDDARRVADLAASAERAKLVQATQSPEEYLRSLEVTLSFSTNAVADTARLASLSNKTNQFNTAFLRQTEAQVAKRLADPACRTYAVALQDKLGDSGIIAAIFARRDGPELAVDEVVISCRALGRNIEHAIVGEALRRAVADLGVNRVRFGFREGPRNGPAREFLASFVGRAPDGDGLLLEWDEGRARHLLARFPLTVRDLETA